MTRNVAAGLIVDAVERLSARSVRFKALVTDVVARLFLADEMRLPAAAAPFTAAALEARTDQLNAAAERYFKEHEDPESLLERPYSDRANFARHLFDIGVLLHWLRVSPGEVVADIGAGSCWLSHLLNRFGCRTISVDVSQTALDLGRKLFARDGLSDWKLVPQFLCYDGHRLPLAAGSVDKIIVFNAFHHIPNQREVRSEMARVLADGGVAAMCEPGREHSHADSAQVEMNETGVLENDIIIEELAPLAERCGFSRVRLVPVSLGQTEEIEAGALQEFMRGHELREHWRRLGNGLVEQHYIILYKGEFVPTTRRPQRLVAKIELMDARRELAVTPASS